ncbi:MAG: hypothetical protein ABSD12_02835 [Paraburkholderia sp.]
MADSAASTQSRTTRASSTKRRANTVSTETENKLARAARSAQRLAQLSDASRDDSTLDMFPDDPTRATLEAMNIDVRQGTLHGFELPGVVLAAVGVTTGLDGAASASPDTRSARRAPREKVEPAYAAVPLDGFERFEPTQKALAPTDEPATTVGLSGQLREQVARAAPKGDVQSTSLPVSLGLVSPSMAAASLVRSVTARRQVGDASIEPTTTGKPGGVPLQRFAETSAKAATASRDGAAVNGETSDGGLAASSTASVEPLLGDAAEVAKASATAGEGKASASVAEATADVVNMAGVAGASAASSGVTGSAAMADAASAPTPARPNAPFAAPLQDTAPTLPELDRARATAFADTVDALYGVISDQRRAATDHSRRMKWMLSIVVGALLATVAIGMTQTVLLMRLTRETTAQQHRIEQLMQNQQTAMTSLLDAHLAVANAAAAAPSGASTPVVAPPAPAAAAAAPVSKHKAHAHAHKPKAAPTR